MAFVFLWLFFAFKVDCSFNYISLKALCHHQDTNVSEIIQKKIYGILAPLFSQKPWNSQYKEPKIDDYSYLQIQAAFYILNLFNLPKELKYEKFDFVSFSMRQYKRFHSQVSFVPFLYEKNVWSLQNEYGLLFQGVFYESDYKNNLKLSVKQYFNYVTDPIAVLKIPEEAVLSLNLTGPAVVCLFLHGSMSIVDLKAQKEVWQRNYSMQNDEVCYADDCGLLITGYNDVICFLDRSNNRFKLYTVFDLMNQKECSYVIQNTTDNCKFDMMLSKEFGSSTAMNSNYFFYAFFKRTYVPYGPHSYFNYSPVDNISTQLYYVSYKDTSKSEKIFYTLQDSELFFRHVACNDTRLIAKDNKNRIYVWNLSQEPCFVLQIIESIDSMLSRKFWLDSDSDKILTEEGIFKIQNVVADLPSCPPILIKPIVEENSLILEPASPVKPGFFKGVCLRIYWFVRLWYWTIKNLLKKYYIS